MCTKHLKKKKNVSSFLSSSYVCSSFSAGSVIRMFMHAIGEEAFKKGLKYYLEAKYVLIFIICAGALYNIRKVRF